MKYILDSNYMGIKKYIKKKQNLEEAIKFANSVFEYDVNIKFQLNWLFYNFLMSAKSLTEHIQKNIAKIKKQKEGIKDYHYKRFKIINRKIEEFKKSNLGNFIREFRNYITHEKLPEINTSQKFTSKKGSNGAVFQNIFKIEIGTLKEDEVFNDGKDYLNQLEEYLVLIDFVEESYEKYKEIFEIAKFEVMKNQIDEAQEKGIIFQEENHENQRN